MTRQASLSTKKHWTPATASQVYEKIHRYTFLERNTALLDGARRGKVKEMGFSEDRIGVFGVRFTPDGNKIIVGYGNGSIEVIDAELMTPLYCVKNPSGDAYPISTIRCVSTTSDIFYAGGICGNVYLCKFQKDSCSIFAEEKNNEITAMDVDLDNEVIITGGKDGALRVYDPRIGKLVSKFFKSSGIDVPVSSAFHSKRIFSIKYYTKHRNTVLSGGWDDCVKIWDLRTKAGCIRNINGPHICGDALDVKDNVVLTGQWTAENALQQWDFGTAKLISTVVPTNRVQTLDGDFLYCCQFFKSEIYPEAVVSGGSGRGNVDVITLPDEKIICTFKVNKLIQALDTTPPSKIVYGGMEHLVRFATIVEKTTN